MKFKTLRSRETKEFVHIDVHQNLNFCSVGTSSTPRILPETATLDGVIEYLGEKKIDVDFDDIEMIELDVFEADVIGADIRNKLTPSLNLIRMLQQYFKEPFEPRSDLDRTKQNDLIRLIKKDMKQSEKCIKYIAKLL